jgi:regulatory protein
VARRRTERAPKAPLDKAALEAAALAYLERYATSAENLRRVLLRRLRTDAHRRERAGEVGAAPDPQLREVIDELITRYTSARLLDDEAFARARATSLTRKGTSARAIQAKLQQRGVSTPDIRRALDSLDEGEDGAAGRRELAAATETARRRKLGPFRADPEARKERRMHDIAALVRRGFSIDVARKVVGSSRDDDVELFHDPA